MNLSFIPVKTRVVRPPKDEIWDIIDGLEVKDGDIVFITSKILAIHQGRAVKVGDASKEELIRREASAYLPYENKGGFHVNLTVTDNVLIPAAGIDESNANGYYVLWPRDADGLCRAVRARIIKGSGLSRLGVVMTDSHTTPLRWGVTGIAIGLAGVEPLRDIRGDVDIFGRKMKVTQVNLVDPLAAMAVLLMGEAAEQTPIAILRGYGGIGFSESGSMEGFKIPPELDIYQPLLEVMKKWK
ncbi:MAG: coenzyme F420-0:L-glutamate ligase [Rickettsiales bacterium]|jgi:F420-0:gamma-glutamyl ligase|nr:coenzyme F420-0:L-glutamate ligase [Rickettsiales bacterium]